MQETSPAWAQTLSHTSPAWAQTLSQTLAQTPLA